MPVVGGCDYHKDYVVTNLLTWRVTYVYAKTNSLKDILDAIVKGRTKICFDVGATFIDIVSGDSVLGDTVKLTDEKSITINVKKLRRKHKLIVFDCEGECFSYTAKKTEDYSVTLPVKKEGFMCAHIVFEPRLIYSKILDIVIAPRIPEQKGMKLTPLNFARSGAIYFEKKPIQYFGGTEMKNKKKAILIAVSVVLVLGIIAGALALYFTRYHKDENDTEELYRQNVASVGYENTIETAYPFTDVYGIIKDHFEAELPEGKTEKKVAVIGYDGCRADILAEKQDNGAIKYLLDNGASISLTYCGGVNYPAENTQATSTAPGWCSMLTGVWSDVHGITGNGITKTVEPKMLMTTLIEKNVIDNAAFITKWKGHFTNSDSTYKDEKAYCEENNIDIDFNLRKNKSDIHTGAMEEITSEDCADFVLIIYENTDSAGHDFGFTFNNPVYKNGFRTEDNYGYKVIKAIEARETYDTEDWLIIVSSDHGGVGTGHGGPSIQERMNFVVMNKDWN